MFDNDPIHKRGQALEDEFFRRVDAQLSEQLREKMEREKAREVLSEATGFDNAELLDHLIDADFEPAKIAALTLAPLVIVAWADGNVTSAERQSVMGEALHRGLEKQPMAMQLIEKWLHDKPPKNLMSLWKEYASAVNETLKPDVAKWLSEQIRKQATEVAEASRRTFDLKRISGAEQAVLDEIEDSLVS